MAKVNVYQTFFERKVLSMIDNSRKKEQEKIAFYLKLYTNLLTAEYKLGSLRGFDHLRIVGNMAKEGYKGESHYLSYISSIVREIISNKATILKILKGDPVADALHSRTQLLMVQNICVLRILKAGKV